MAERPDLTACRAWGVLDWLLKDKSQRLFSALGFIVAVDVSVRGGHGKAGITHSLPDAARH